MTRAIRALPASAAADLRRVLRGRVIAPGERDFDSARHVWNAMVDKRPALIAQPLDAADVAKAIGYARAAGMEVGVRCGGHSVTGISVPDGGLLIDLERISEVRVDVERRTARVGGGALLRDLDRATVPHRLATTAGNVSHTGVGGLTLGGGMGWLARQFGLACDNTLSYTLVTADGEVLTVSQHQDADLFWGLRGGGGNFGVVTEFTFRLHPIVDRALSVDVFFAPEQGTDVLRAYAAWAPGAPRECIPTAWAGTAGDWPFLPEELRGQPLVAAGYAWVGDPQEARALIPAIRAFGRSLAEATDETSYLELQSGSDAPMRHGMRRYWKGHYLRELSDEAIGAFLARGGDGATFRPGGSLQGYGGAIGEVGIGDSAFSHRDARFEFVTLAGWEDPAEDAARIEAMRGYARSLEPFASGVYVNGLNDEGPDGIRRAYYEQTLDRLVALKDRLDPGNVFHLNHNVRPSGTASA
ncbi:MAG TPA: FAD-binding oxidoreductase [Candidatus Limnocylindria bacterium]